MAKACARHILVATEGACEELKTQIEAGTDFAAAAKDHSQCPSGQRGGDLGEFSPGRWSRNSTTSYFMPGSDKYMVRSRRSLAITLLRLPVAPSKGPTPGPCRRSDLYATHSSWCQTL